MNQTVINNLAAKINSKEQKSNKVASWNSTPSDDKYPSEKLVKDSLDGKANSTHYHGNLQNNGQVGGTAQANKNVVTDNTGKITTENKPTIPTSTSDLINDGEDGNNPFIDDSDSRLSDSRTPLSHSHGYITNDGKLNIQNDSTDFLFNTPIVAHTNIFSNTSDIVKGYFSSDYVKLFDNLTNLNVDGGTTLSSTLSTIDTAIGNKANNSHTHGNLQNNGQVGGTAQSNKNVVTDGNGLITTEDKPTIPNASSTTPSADTTNGSVGNGTTWARSNHTHPKSSIYAESNHNHNIWELNQTDNNSMTAFEFAQGDGGYDGESDAYYVLGKLYYDIEQDSMYYDNNQGQGLYGYGEEIATIADIPNINGKEDLSNKVTSLSSSSTDTQYPSAKAVYDFKQSVEIQEDDDLNDYTEVGMYYCPFSTIAVTLTNCPITNAFSLFVEKSSGYENACTQTITGFDGTRIKKFSRFIQTVDGTFQNSGWQPLYEDTGWKAVTYSSGYSAYSSGEAVRYRRIGKVVHLEGAFKNANALTSSNTDVKFASISDSTCRPSKTQVTLQQASGANKFILTITPNGDLKWSRYGTTVTNTSISSGSWFNCFATWFVD